MNLKVLISTAILTSLASPGALGISNIANNAGSYPGGQVPKFAKFEVSFQVNGTVATNFQWPYDTNTPTGVTPGQGITVNAQFTPDNWSTVYTQPAFHYQPFQYQKIGSQDWLYPTGNAFWLVRFAPNQIGTWKFRLTAQDAGGTTQSADQSFTVTDSANHGFVRVSAADPRYFEFSDGTYFPGLGYNMNFNLVSWNNPVSDNQNNFTIMGQNGIQLVRLWFSQWAAYGAKWNPWRCILSACNPDWPELSNNFSYLDHQVAITMYATYNPCMSSGHWLSPPIAIKPNTTYRIRARVRTDGIVGPRVGGQPFGFVAKVTDDGNSWLQGGNNNCQDAGVGKTVTTYLGTSDWTEITGTYTSPNVNFLSSFYLTLTNVTAGAAYVDQIVMEENLGSNTFGPNVLLKPGMNHHQYVDQNLSARFDKVVELAEQNGVYLRPVILEWADDIPPIIDPTFGFYGNWRQPTEVRWLQQMYWRYLQARWGYSPAIQSWELVNEGDPFNSALYALTDELGKYMHCRVFGVEPGIGDGAKCNLNHPNSHLVSTSTWSQWPKDQFWANANYPNVDFADIHRYISKAPDSYLDPNFYDTAKSTYDNSMAFGAKEAAGAGKPVIRGETGLTDSGTQPGTSDLLPDVGASWLHNMVWGGINSGGLIESYWYSHYEPYGHIYTSAFDHRGEYGNYYRFIKDIPLNNGAYQDIAALVSDPNLRAWGQKDLAHGAAHLWIANAKHTWQAVVNHTVVPPITATVTLSGFAPNKMYRVQWWDTSQGTVTRTAQIRSNGTGNLSLSVSNLVGDLAVKMFSSAEIFLPLVTNR